MLSISDSAIVHALTNVRYQIPAWLLNHTIEATDYDEILTLLLSFCKSHALTLSSPSLFEQKSKNYFKKYGFYHFLFDIPVNPETVSLITLEDLQSLRILSQTNTQQTKNPEHNLKDAEALLLKAKADDPCFMKVQLIPFGGPIETRPKAVFCTNACLTNVLDIWRFTSFSIDQ